MITSLYRLAEEPHRQSLAAPFMQNNHGHGSTSHPTLEAWDESHRSHRRIPTSCLPYGLALCGHKKCNLGQYRSKVSPPDAMQLRVGRHTTLQHLTLWPGT